jgi:hypothetical protein
VYYAKEQKNFFVPFLSPFDEYFDLPTNYNIKNRNDFEKWERRNQRVVSFAKAFHFDPRKIYVSVDVSLPKSSPIESVFSAEVGIQII